MTPASPSSQAGMSTAPPGNQQAGMSSFSSAVSMLAPLPGQTFSPSAPQPYGYPSGGQFQQAVPVQAPAAQPMPSDRWDNMATLFQTVRDHARSYEYPAASVAALETVLIRLYLESPLGGMPLSSMQAAVQSGIVRNIVNGHQANMNGDATGSSNANDGS